MGTLGQITDAAGRRVFTDVSPSEAMGTAQIARGASVAYELCTVSFFCLDCWVRLDKVKMKQKAGKEALTERGHAAGETLF